MKRDFRTLDAAAVLLVAGASVVMFSFAFFSFFDGLDWPALAFAAGGISLCVWAGIRLTGAGR